VHENKEAVLGGLTLVVGETDTEIPEKPKPDRSRKRDKDATCFTVEFQIEYSPKQRKRANARFNSGTILYNACLRESFDRAQTMRSDSRWLQAQKLPKTINKEPNTERTKLFNDAKTDAKFSAYELGSFGTKMRVGSLRNNVLSQEAQTIAVQAYNAVADWVYSGKGRPRYLRAA